MTSATTLSHRLETNAGKLAFIRNNEIWTYGRLASEIERLARGFIERGIRPGDRVALHMANLLQISVGGEECELVAFCTA